jgi:tetratricopeptide (TPR) repeat protein
VDKDKKTDVAALSQEGYKLFRSGRYSEAIERFESVLEQDPENSYALVGLGDVARKQGRSRVAVEVYNRCIETDPDNAVALFGLADAYRSLRKYHDALRIWERYLEHDQENVTVLTRVADAYRKVRDKQRSQELYEKVLSIEEDNPYALIGLGHLHFDFREYEEALLRWNRMYELGGENVDIRVLTSIGNCYRKLKDFEGGLPYFEQAIAKEPENFYALFGLADCYRGMNEPEQSLTFWNRILRNDPENRVILTRAGDAYRSLGELEQAKHHYDRALAQGEDIYARLGLALVVRTRCRTAEAIDLLTSLTRREPENHRIYTELAATHAQNGDHAEAVAVLEELKSRGHSSSYVDELISRYRSGR